MLYIIIIYIGYNRYCDDGLNFFLQRFNWNPYFVDKYIGLDCEKYKFSFYIRAQSFWF